MFKINEMALLVFLLYYSAIASGEYKEEFQEFEVDCLSENVFECQSGSCILLERFCDGNYDCKDGSDENFCVGLKPDAKYCNATHQYLCGDGKKCIPYSWICNAYPNCDDGSDELNCTTPYIAGNATCKGFQCDGNRCISNFWMCDGNYDCEDLSDEDIEDTCRHALRPRKVNTGLDCHTVIPGLREKEYDCVDKSFCLPKESMCDGIQDCKDGSDEGPFCQNWLTMCLNHTCGNSSTCYPDRSGRICDCKSMLHQYNYTTDTCEGVDNCLDDIPWCSHYCNKTNISFICTCDSGYVTDDIRYLCYAPDPEAMLLYSTRNDIRYIKVKSKEMRVLVTGIEQAHGVTFDGQYIYWVEMAQGHQAIVRAHVGDPQETKEVLVALGLEDPGDIAVDWLGGNIYFSDVQRGVIAVCKADGTVCSVLSTKTRKPRFVTLDSRKGVMYWVDWQNKGSILTARMDGTNPETLLEGIKGAGLTALALDSPNDRLYFVDGTIKVLKLFDRKVYPLFDGSYLYPSSVAVFENTVYWSEFTSETIQTIDKLHSDKRGLLANLTEAVFDMHIYHPLLMQDKINPCLHAGCSHICVPTSNATFSCLCPDGMALSGKLCKAIPDYRPEYLIVGGGSLFTRIQYKVLGNPETHATHFDIGRVQAMAYDNFRDTLYVYDGHRKAINYINVSDFTLGMTHLLVYNSLENVVDMGYDYVSDTLYILDAGSRMIEVISLRTKTRTLLYRFSAQETPISFCILPNYGRLVVAVAESEFNIQINIDSIGLDGGDRKHLITNKIVGPKIRLQYSAEKHLIYIADEGNGVIDYVHPEATRRDHFRDFSTSLESLAVTGSHVFWTDTHSTRLYWAEVQKAGYRVRRMGLSMFVSDTVLYLQATSAQPNASDPLLKHPCHQEQTPCAYMCVQSERTTRPVMGYRCLCPAGQVLVNNTCEKVKRCQADENYCHRSNQCFRSIRRCDGNNDCKYGEDEENCQNSTTSNAKCQSDQKLCFGACIDKYEVCNDQTVTCGPTEALCGYSAICIDISSFCDGHPDCPDGSDEVFGSCSTFSCQDFQFMCTSGYCIPSSWQCDKDLDCVDGSDEANCAVTEKSCEEGYHRCGDGTCIELLRRCDAQFDCTDESDEQNCDMPEIGFTETTRACHQWELMCARNNTNVCLPLTARCNGKVDCDGGTDETDCDFHCAPKAMYACKQELHCVSKKQMCNGINDCTDGSDETIEACVKVNKTVPARKLDSRRPCPYGLRCGSGECIEWSRVCDNVTDCVDGSDERANCSMACNICPNFCRRTPTGPTCVCPRGYTNLGNNCVDVDECKTNICSHICTNTPGSFVCTCHPGYELRYDRRSCKALQGETMLLYGKGDRVWSVMSHRHFLEHTYQNKTIVDMDYDTGINKLYVAVPETGEIIEVNKQHRNATTTAISNIGRPVEISVDWATENIYFVDEQPEASYIRVCNIERKSCARLRKLPYKVTSLVVDSRHHAMFYCVKQTNGSKIYSGSLAGRVVNIASVANCSGLATDNFDKYLYILDNPGTLWRTGYDGRNMVALYSGEFTMRSAHNPIIFDDYIYFLDRDKVNRCQVFGKKTCQTYEHVNATSFVIRRASVRVDNVCANSPCTGVCVIDGGAVCLCADGSVANPACPIPSAAEVPFINGEQQGTQSSTLTYTLVIVIAALCVIYVVVFVYYKSRQVLRGDAQNYFRVHFRNRPSAEHAPPEAGDNLRNAVIEAPTAGNVDHEYVNPLNYIRDMWNNRFSRTRSPEGDRPILVTQQSATETESDVNEQMQSIET